MTIGWTLSHPWNKNYYPTNRASDTSSADWPPPWPSPVFVSCPATAKSADRKSKWRYLRATIMSRTSAFFTESTKVGVFFPPQRSERTFLSNKRRIEKCLKILGQYLTEIFSKGIGRIRFDKFKKQKSIKTLLNQQQQCPPPQQITTSIDLKGRLNRSFCQDHYEPVRFYFGHGVAVFR